MECDSGGRFTPGQNVFIWVSSAWCVIVPTRVTIAESAHVSGIIGM